MDRVVQVEVLDDRGEIVGVVVHVVVVGDLRGPAVAAAVVRDDPVTRWQEEQHLVVPVVGRQRPAVAEHDRLARAPVLEEDVNAVARGDGGHADPLLVLTLPMTL